MYGGGWDVTTGQATTMFRFEDDVINPTKRLYITLSLKRLSVRDAADLARTRRIDLPELDDASWSITLPPDPERLDESE